MRERTKKFITHWFGPLDTYEKKNTFILTAIAVIGFGFSAVIWALEGEGVIAAYAVFFSVLIFIGSSVLFRKGRDQIAAIVLLAIFILLVMPTVFLEFDGSMGDGVPIILLIALFVTLCLSGKKRIFMIGLHFLVAFVLYYIMRYKPEYITFHKRGETISDAYTGLIFSAAIIYVILILQTNLLKNEAKRAQKETERAEELNRSQNRFFSSMSHEIRTPINSILGLNEIILRQEDASDEVKRDAKNIQGAGKMLLSLVNDILDISKIEAGKMDVVPVNYELGTMISDIVNMIWLKVEEKGLKFSVEIDPALPKVLFGDEVRIRQILINLLNNAVKYTKEGSVKLHLQCESRDSEQVQMLMSVIDTGMGIRPEAIPYLFDLFQRADEEKNRKIEGTGLGLSIVKQLVELMGGKISADSIYAQGSTFTVSLTQKISNGERIGDISISNFKESAGKVGYKSSFTAPEARILIVDDNELNLEVEKKLLSGTKMVIDTAVSGAGGLEKTLINKYDVILLDHLMPGMDGIECLSAIRMQKGGFNTQVPILALTANAGSENRALYSRSGFDDYLVKPVSGKQLEEMLIRYLPQRKVIRNENAVNVMEINTARGYMRKMPIVITTSSLCDLPESVIGAMNVDVIPFTVQTSGGTFLDNVETSPDELVKYMLANGQMLRSEPPTEEAFVDFFAEEVKKAHHVIHIALTTSMSKEYERATKAAQTFENVTVINSEVISSAAGLLVMAAAYLVDQNVPYERIIPILESLKKNIHCSFTIAQTDYMANQGFLGKNINMFMKSMKMRPSLFIRNNKFGIRNITFGRLRKSYEKYIHRALPKGADPDRNVIFVTHVNLSAEEQEWIREEIQKLFSFKYIIFQKASAAVSLNCGPGTFGLLYMDLWHSAFFFDKYLIGESDISNDYEEPADVGDMPDEAYGSPVKKLPKARQDDTPSAEGKWYEGFEGIDGAAAVKNSGSEEALRKVMRVFYDSIGTKSEEIQSRYEEQDWKNYTIKVHALKSSARLVGALELGIRAEKMENAGKEEDLDYIHENHEALLSAYRRYSKILSPLYGQPASENFTDERPAADPELMESVYHAIREAAEDFDIDRIEDIFEKMKDYRIPDVEKERMDQIRVKCGQFDYSAIVDLLS